MKTAMFQWKPHPTKSNGALSKAIGLGPWETGSKLAGSDYLLGMSVQIAS